MLYELQVLRNIGPEESKTNAIKVLDDFKYHLLGQPCAIRYKDGEDIKVLFAVGKEDYRNSERYASVNPSDHYEIINKDSLDTALYWQKFNDTIEGLIKDEERGNVEIIYSNIEDYNEGKDKGLIANNQIVFTAEDGTGINRIFLDDNIFSSNSLNDLKVGEDIENGSIVIDKGSTFEQVIEAISKAMNNMNLKWNTGEDLHFNSMVYGDYKSKKLEISKYDENKDFIEAKISDDLSSFYVKDKLIGDAYISNIYDIKTEMPYSLGDFHYGDNVQNVYDLTGQSINELIDRILFPKHLWLNYGIITKPDIKKLFEDGWVYVPGEDGGKPIGPIEIEGGGEGGESDHEEILRPEIDEIIDNILHYGGGSHDKPEASDHESIKYSEIDNIIEHIKEDPKEETKD